MPGNKNKKKKRPIKSSLKQSCTKLLTVVNSCCPHDKDLLDVVNEKKPLRQRYEGFAIIFVMFWTTTQLAVFIILLILFLFSNDNPFMQSEDCCDATEYLIDTNFLPYESCGNLQCQLYDTVFNGDRDMIQFRPRKPLDGDYSIMFSYEGTYHCCNLAVSRQKCCNKMPYNFMCGAIMWSTGFSAVCAMFMTQVILQGFYSFVSRKRAFMIPFAAIPGTLMRTLIFCVINYIFFGFMFLFMHFWISMFYCDNPHAFSWWEFGGLYVAEFFNNLEWVTNQGVTTWDGNMDMDSMVATHTAMAMFVDIFFGLLYFGFSRIKDNSQEKRNYLHLEFFHL